MAEGLTIADVYGYPVKVRDDPAAGFDAAIVEIGSGIHDQHARGRLDVKTVRTLRDWLNGWLAAHDENSPVLIDRATIECVLLDHREELDDDKGKVSPSLAELAHVYRGLTGFDAKVEAAKSCREILAELTSESIEAGTYDQPAEVIELTPEEYQQAAQHALAELGCTMDELASMASRGDYPTPAHRKVWLAIKPAPAQPETPGE